MGIINDPAADNTAGRVDALKYDVLPNLLKSEAMLIIKALRVYCGAEKETPKQESQLTFFSLNSSTKQYHEKEAH